MPWRDVDARGAAVVDTSAIRWLGSYINCAKVLLFAQFASLDEASATTLSQTDVEAALRSPYYRLDMHKQLCNACNSI